MPYPHGKANPRSIGTCLLRGWADSPDFPDFPTKKWWGAGGQPNNMAASICCNPLTSSWKLYQWVFSIFSEYVCFSEKRSQNKEHHALVGSCHLFKWDLATNQWGLALASVWWALVVPLDNVEGKISRLEAPFWWLSTRDTGDWEACIQALFIGSSWGGGVVWILHFHNLDNWKLQDCWCTKSS